MEEIRVEQNINIKSSLLHKCNIAAVTGKKTLGEWLDEAIMEKLEKDHTSKMKTPRKERRLRVKGKRNAGLIS